MSYARPRYGFASSPAYGHPETSHEPQPQQDYAFYDHSNGYPNPDSYHEHTYYSTPYQSDNYPAPRGRLAGHEEENRYYGGTAQNGGMRQDGRYGGPAMQQPQQRAGSDVSYAYREARGRLVPQSKPGPPVYTLRSPPVNRYPQAGAQPVVQSPQAQGKSYREEPARTNVPIQADAAYHQKDQYYEQRDGYSHHSQRPRIATSRSAEAVQHRPRPEIHSQQQEISNFHGARVVQAGTTSHRPSSAPKTASSQGQRQPTPPKVTAQHSKPRKRILEDLSLPNTLAWDNPFPTFPVAKKNANQTDGNSLNAAVGRMNIQNDTHRDQTQGQRPSTANDKRSTSSSFDNERQSNMKQMQYHPNQQYQTKRDGHEESNDIRPQHNQLQYNLQPHKFQHKDTAYEVPVYQGNGTEEWPIPHNSQDPGVIGRRSEDANAVSSLRPPKLAFDAEFQRSKTMSSGLIDAPLSSGLPSKYGDPSWQEPGPNAGYYGPTVTEYLPNSPARTQPSRPRPANHSKPEFDVYSPIQSNPYQTPSSAHPRLHSAQDSIGDLFDSYYDASHHDQGTYGHNSTRHTRSEIDKDMPNFDAIPKSGTSHEYDMTIDEHLEPHNIAPAVPPMPAQYWGAESGYSRTDRYSSKQVSRSRSSPNLKEPRSPKSPYYGSFDFDMPGVVPALPTQPLLQGFSGSAPQNTNRHPSSNQHIYGQPNRPYNDQRPGPSASRSPGNGASNYGAQPTSSQDRARHDQHQPSVPQNTRPSTGQDRQSSNRVGHISQTGATESRPVSAPSNPDALPMRPAPVRPGLIQGSQGKQAPKPTPIRQYNTGSSPLHQANPTGPPDPSSRAFNEKSRNLAPVTQEELERLRQSVLRNPSDQKTQLILARKMVEAASVLVDQRADQRTKAKMREKYILDAHKIVKRLVNNGYADASFYLADCYSRGLLGLETDAKEAFNLYQSAAKAGHPQAAYRVAVCCEMGQEEGGGTKRDPSKAMQWYKRAATLGDTPAMYKMGIVQLKGLLGQAKNSSQAVTWLKRAAERADEENPHALHELGLLHEKDGGNEGVIKDEVYSTQLFTQAAKFGYKFSQFRLGCAYEYGSMGCPVDPRQSIAWYSKAAVQEEHQSELALSGWYLTGSEGVLQQSDTEAYLWARKAAQARLAKAEYAMGYFTEVGIGAPANLEDAKRWYWRAASQNFPKARDRLEDLRKGGAKMEKTRVSRSAVNTQSEGDCVVM